MDSKIARFLKSLHIENVEDFDVSFDMIGKNRFNEKQWDFVILKETPWEYKYLKQFIDGLAYINYPYTLRFSYLVRPNFLDVISIFEEWYQSIYHTENVLDISGDDKDRIYVEYKSEEQKDKYSAVIKDFKDFLNFIFYEFVVIESVKEDDSPIVSKAEMKKIVKEAKVVLEESKKEAAEFPTDNDRNDIDEYIEDKKKEMAAQVEDTLLAEMKENFAVMQKERARIRLNKRGNYMPVDNIDSVTSRSQNIDINGKVFFKDVREFNEGRCKIIIGVADDLGGAIYADLNGNIKSCANIIDNVVNGVNVRVRGVSYFDEKSKCPAIRAHMIDLLPPDVIEPEKSEYHRVELHLHSNMSSMDGITDMSRYCHYAHALGHKAIAITDHAVVQGFPDAQKGAKDNQLKMLYGCEFYMVDDVLDAIKNPAKIKLNKAKYCVLDLETTGLSSVYNKIIEFGAVIVEDGFVKNDIDILIDPQEKLSSKIINLTDITDDLLEGKPTIDKVIHKIADFIGDAIIVTHNASFDVPFLQENLKKLGLPELTNPVIDTLPLSRYLFPDSSRHRLGALCRRLDIEYDEESAHRANYDARVLGEAWLSMVSIFSKKIPDITHEDLGNLEVSSELIQHLHPSHVIALAKDSQGLKDLYKLVTASNIDYLADVPKLPRKILKENRDHLIIGSACFNGEVFETARYYNKERLKEVMKFYDYIEIQPLENYSHLINMMELREDELLTFIKNIVECAGELNKPVCATGDVHYLTPKEKIFRDIFIFGEGLKKTKHPLNPYNRSDMPKFENPDQHFRSTQEMLKCMSFLGEEKAFEVTVTNTNMIADQIDVLVPLPNDKVYNPSMEGCEEKLRNIIFTTAKEKYGDPIPDVIQKRLETELNGIISHGYAVIYYIAHCLVKKANDDGYIVGSRGSVGSSLAATMAGITEVNALPPHYICPKCHHLEWTSQTHPEYLSGYDLPDKVCPVCGTLMKHDGQNIPFETFLGFHADKVPDIDLNFPGDYQSKAHDYTKVLFGEQNVFRAGTIETVKEKTAFGYARAYVEKMGFNPDEYSKSKLGYLASGCVGIKRTTGQHPGGIVVIPKEYEVCDFTPAQWPADDKESSWKTTHFDFRSMHDTILKLDLLGHVDPLALRMMCNLANVNIKDIPMNDSKVISLFSSPDALGLKSNFLGHKTGALAIPEFGTGFVRGILESTKPQSFSDLVIISGISHGTNVWQGNAEKLIAEKVASLRQVIGCRDDIMTYLISMGVPNEISFFIMEDVRKGRGLKPEYVEIMKANKVPQYYIDSCNKIKYMFPKGHAVAYVTMAIRVGYFKIYYPLEFYATFFSVRSKAYDVEPMLKGREAIINRYTELRDKSRSRQALSPKEEEQMDTLEVALEMVERGYSFGNIDLYRSDATNFVVDHEHNCILLPFIVLDGLGENAAQSVIEARKNGAFTSKQNLLKRTRLSQTNIAQLDSLGALNSLGETDQISLFDF